MWRHFREPLFRAFYPRPPNSCRRRHLLIKKKLPPMWEEMTKSERLRENPSFLPEPDCCTDDSTKTDEEEDFQNLLMLASGHCPDLLLQLQQAAEVDMFPKHPPIDVPALPTATAGSKSGNNHHDDIMMMALLDGMTEDELLMSSHHHNNTTPLKALDDVVTTSSPAADTVAEKESSPFLTMVLDTKPPVALLEEIYKLRHELNTLRKEITLAFSSMDFKRVRKNRTLKNRCSFVNRRGEGCRGYKCKIPGSTLCYAHHILSAASCYPERRAKLY